MDKRIITISRQYGSGGHAIARMVAEKLDIPFYDSQLITEVAKQSGFSEAFVKENGWEMMYISAYTGENLDEMVAMVEKRLNTLPPVAVYDREYDETDSFVQSGKETVITRENDKFIVEGDWLYNLMGQINFDNYESLDYFQRVLSKSGVFKALEDHGCQDGDTVSLYGFEFDYVK